MSSLISDQSLTEYLDALANVYLLARGSDPAGVGTPSNPNGYGLGVSSGTWGAADDVLPALQAVVDAALVGIPGIDPIVALASATQALINNVNTKLWAANTIGPCLQALQNQIASSQVTGANTLDQLLTIRNCTGVSKWTIMVPPAMAQLFNDIYNASLSANNVWYEVLTGAAYLNGIAKLVISGASFTDGFDVDTTKFCGGFPYLKTTTVMGSGLVTVTGTAYDPSQVGVGNPVTPGATWVYTFSSNPADANTYALTPGGAQPAPSNSLLVDASAIVAAGGLTSGTIEVEAHRPAGRGVFSYA